MTKAELKECRASRLELRQILSELESLESELISPKIPKTSDMPPYHPVASDQMAESVAKWVDLQQVYRDRISQCFSQRRDVEKAMDILTSIERQIIRAYYIDGKTWEEVCIVVNYSWRETHRKHASALKKMAQNGTLAL